MKKSILVLGALFLFVSCNKDKSKNTSEKDNTDTLAINKSDFNIEALPQNCYFMLNNNDTIFVTIDDNLGTITGKIQYSKDSIGELLGFAAEDTLKLQAQYKISRDSIVTKDIWFLRKFDNLYEGLGERHHDGTYLHPSFLKYEEKAVYKPIDCKE